MLKHLRFDTFELQEAKLPVRLINTTNERRQVQGHETPLRLKGDSEDVSSELDNGGVSSRWAVSRSEVATAMSDDKTPQHLEVLACMGTVKSYPQKEASFSAV
ncbi:hypothetical protein TNCV_3055091 [Trichonephila clavipes]|nr:hypothetical protein TNCV_3055091 [Trichonephila clavipes]